MMVLSDSTSKAPIPRTIKLAVGFFLVYALLKAVTGIVYSLGATSPVAAGTHMGRATKILFWAAVVTWALLRQKKYGWGFSVVVVGIYTLTDIKDYITMLLRVSSGEAVLAVTVGFVIVIALPVATLVALAMPASREPFTQLAEEESGRAHRRHERPSSPPSLTHRSPRVDRK